MVGAIDAVEMPQQNIEDTSTSAHAMNLEVVGDEAAQDEHAADQGAGDDGGRRGRPRGIVSRLLRPFTYSPIKFTPPEINKKQGKGKGKGKGK